MTSITLSTLLSASLVMQAAEPCPPKTTACANNICVSLGAHCPSVAEAVGASAPPAPPAPRLAAAQAESAKAIASEWREIKRLRHKRGRTLCLEPLVDFEHRQIMRRLGFMLPGAAAFATSTGLFFGAHDYRRTAEAIDSIYIEGFPDVYDPTLRNSFLAGGVLFALLGLGLMAGGVASARSMQRASGSCTTAGCTFALRF